MRVQIPPGVVLRAELGSGGILRIFCACVRKGKKMAQLEKAGSDSKFPVSRKMPHRVTF